MSEGLGKPMAGLVYFLSEPELKRVKIGYSGQDVRNRIRGLQAGNSQILKLLAVVSGGRVEESELHKRFSKWRLIDRLEWFEASEDMIAEMWRTVDELNGVRM